MLLLVTVSTMSMAIRERMRELAVLKAIGFQRGQIVGFILAESFGLAMLGALLGVGGAWAIFNNTQAVQNASQGILLSFEVTARIAGIGVASAAALGIVASLLPASAAARMSVVTGLKTLD
jgi:putative ABC transport system permease protein